LIRGANTFVMKAHPREDEIKSGRLQPGMSFSERVWAVTAQIPRGKVVTYGDIARKLNCNAYRAVGNALNKNPFAPQVPCHRVVGSDGSLTGFAGGLEKKRKLLSEEGVPLKNDGKVDLSVRCDL
jgi:methylated-DNA-[protein]-cysteine S-methyltransferase